ncbi:6-phosphogluconolactonase [Pseudoxanthomonas sacheonensis]|uniref:6-phosphogluconolactonase n=1 Tax=Pseudoxanthomonas sacheonensis TaxID=443615 RepID=A0ABU1RSU5_9GAMM|nr:6-phosphogluconolactonase [Pseudoxanthomonas sacheonensis]MDR6841846.1 6-phosphogluconolactonase [Pseudoxanthomonas sacheonensis]
MSTDLSTQIQHHTFADPQALANALAHSVAEDLRAALAVRDTASIALSGGNTPKAFMQALALQELDWPGVMVTLVDERWVPESSERSNAALVRSNLLHGPAAQARFVPLYRDAPDPESAIGEIEDGLAILPRPFDVVVLGMGNDGHTASFFPGGDHLAAALDPATTALALPMRAPAAGEPRITLTLPPILAARRLYLHIEGISKQEVLAQAVSGEGQGAAYPIRSVLKQARSRVQIYWTA